MDTRKEMAPEGQEDQKKPDGPLEDNGLDEGQAEAGQEGAAGEAYESNMEEMPEGESEEWEEEDDGEESYGRPNIAVRFFCIVFKYLKIIFRPLFKLLGFLFRSLFILCVVVLVAVIGIGAYKVYPLYTEYKKEAVQMVADSSLDTFRLQESSFIYDRQGNVIAKLTKDEDSDYLPYDTIPENAVNAFVAIEDRTFWDNSGYDLRGIIRVALNYFKTDGEEVHGASTITQQLARNRFLTREVQSNEKLRKSSFPWSLRKNIRKNRL